MALPTPPSIASSSPGWGGFGLATALTLLEEDTASPASRRLAAHPKAFPTRFAGLLPRAAGSALVLMLLALPGAAQENDTAESLEAFFEQVAVDIVNVEVYVTDKEGNPVGGLTRDDFSVTEDGRPVELINFYRVTGGRPAPDSSAAVEVPQEKAPPTPLPRLPRPSAELAVPESQRLHLIIYVDNFNIHPLNRNRVFRRLREFLSDTIHHGDEVMVASYDRSLHIRQPFTGASEVANGVLLELEGLSGMAIERESERSDALKEIYETDSLHKAQFRAKQFAENQYHEVRTAIDALREMLDSLAGLPGRKMLLHVSDGLPMVPGQDLYQAIQQKFADISALGEAFSRDLSRPYTELIAYANSSRISFYTIDAGGLRTRSGMAAENAAVNTMQPTNFMAVDGVRASNLQGTLRMMANRTGGLAILNTNDVTAGLERIASDFGNYYSLGYRAPTFERGRYHKIDVRLRNEIKGWRIRHREGYRDKSLATQIADSTRAFLVHGYEMNPLGVSIDLGPQSETSEGMTSVAVRVRIPMAKIVLLPRSDFYEGRLMLYFAAVDENGRDAPLQEIPLVLRIPQSSIERARQDEVTRIIDATMRPGPHRLVLVVRDEIGEERSIVGRFLTVASR